jgi:hypothetical protein
MNARAHPSFLLVWFDDFFFGPSIANLSDLAQSNTQVFWPFESPKKIKEKPSET